jgi:hypothetical protein
MPGDVLGFDEKPLDLGKSFLHPPLQLGEN